MKRPSWVPPAALVSGVLLLGVVAEVSRPKPQQAATGPVARQAATIPASAPEPEAPLKLVLNATAVKVAPIAAKMIVMPPGGVDRYTRTPHTRLRCNDPEIAQWKLVESVWEIWCIGADGKTEQRVEGAWPVPAYAKSEMKGVSDEYRNGIDRSLRSIGGGSSAQGPLATGDRISVGADRSGQLAAEGTSAAGIYGSSTDQPQQSVSLRESQALQAVLHDQVAARCSSLPLSDPTQGQCGFYRVHAGDRYRSRIVHGPSHSYLTAEDLPLATPGDWMLADGHLIHDVRLLPCAHPNVAAGAQRWANVFCVGTAGELVRLRADDEHMTALRLLADHAHIESWPEDMRPTEGAVK